MEADGDSRKIFGLNGPPWGVRRKFTPERPPRLYALVGSSFDLWECKTPMAWDGGRGEVLSLILSTNDHLSSPAHQFKCRTLHILVRLPDWKFDRSNVTIVGYWVDEWPLRLTPPVCKPELCSRGRSFTFDFQTLFWFQRKMFRNILRFSS